MKGYKFFVKNIESFDISPEGLKIMVSVIDILQIFDLPKMDNPQVLKSETFRRAVFLIMNF